MFVIHKLKLEIIPEQIVELPGDSNILTLQAQENIPTMWYSFDPSSEEKHFKLKILMVGTGYKMDLPHDSHKYGYLSTLQIEGFVWHFFFLRKQL